MIPSPPFILSELFIQSPDYYIQMILDVKRKITQNSQLTLADFDLHFIQDLSHLLIRNPKIFCDLKAHDTGKFSCF
jgi:hypothetical protein